MEEINFRALGLEFSWGVGVWGFLGLIDNQMITECQFIHFD